MTGTSPTPSAPPKPSPSAAGLLHGAHLAPAPEPLLNHTLTSSGGDAFPACSIEDEPADPVMKTGLVSPLLSVDPVLIHALLP